MDPVAERGACGEGSCSPRLRRRNLRSWEYLIGGRGNAVAARAGSSASIVPLLLVPGLVPQKPSYRQDIGGIIREMSTPASLSWRRYGSNEVLNEVSAGPASALRYELR